MIGLLTATAFRPLIEAFAGPAEAAESRTTGEAETTGSTKHGGGETSEWGAVDKGGGSV